MGEALRKLSEEDPTFRVHSDENSGQTIIEGMGELHLEVIVDRMMREALEQGEPQIGFEVPDLLTDGGLRDSVDLRGLGETFRFGQVAEYFQALNLHKLY